MAGNVKKLRRMKSRLAGEADASLEVAFELMCECGQSIYGVRRTTAIQKQCDHCGESLFVLPVNVYPATKSVTSEVIGGSFADRLKTIVSEIFPARKPRPTSVRDTENGAAETQSTAEQPAGETAVVKPRRKLTLPKVDVKAALRRTFTPFRLVMLAMISVVGLTGYWLIQQKAQEAAQQTWLQSSDEIESLLKEDKVVDLERLLKQSVAAGRTLGKDDAEWRGTLNLYQQTQAINRLSGTDLLSAFHETYQDGKISPDGLQKLADCTRSGSFVFDSWLSEDFKQPQTFQIEMPAAAGSHRVSATIKLPQLQQLVDRFPDGRILFAASVASVIPPSERIDSQWEIELAGESLVLMTNERLCRGIGLLTEFDEELAVVLQRQDEFVRSSESWEFRADDITNTIAPESNPAEDAL